MSSCIQSTRKLWHMLVIFNPINKNECTYLFLDCGYSYMSLTCFGVQIASTTTDSISYEASHKRVSAYQIFVSILLNLEEQETQGLGRGTAQPQRPPRFHFIKSQYMPQCYPGKDTKHSGKLDNAWSKGMGYPKRSAKQLMLSFHTIGTQHPSTTRRAEKMTGWGRGTY